MSSEKTIGLALSGGGIRAAVFHAGVLKYLASENLLNNIAHISSVSGGSLLTGMVFRQDAYRWPSSDQYINEFLPNFKTLLTTKSLQMSALLRLILIPQNWKYTFSRANIIAQSIEKVWRVSASLEEISVTPTWSINCTTGETGRRFRFKNKTMGDYELGYAGVGDFQLAKAMAISAAFPGGIGPLALKTQSFSWLKREDWMRGATSEFIPPFPRIHLYDGGLYDNLGIEPLFDAGAQKIKADATLTTPINYLIVSDGGAPLSRTTIPHPLNPFRFKRIADIALDQTRALRTRSFINFLQKTPNSGAFLSIGSTANDLIRTYTKGRETAAKTLSQTEWLPRELCNKAATYKTSLGQLTEADYELILRHGFETAKCNIELFHKTNA